MNRQKPWQTEKTLLHLEWEQILERLQDGAICYDAKQTLGLLRPTLSAAEIHESQSQIDSILTLVKAGYTPPINALDEITPILDRLKKNSLLSQEELFSLKALFDSCLRLTDFIEDFGHKSETLAEIGQKIQDFRPLSAEFEKVFDNKGQVKDSASEPLSKLRRSIKDRKNQIEKTLSHLMTYGDVATYLQDNFYTMRNDRYVVPLRLDGSGRVAGKIHDMSESGNSYFFEPKEIADINDKLNKDLLSEKVEIIKILSRLTQLVFAEIVEVELSYQSILELDILTSKAKFADSFEGCIPELSPEPLIDLKDCFHPLLNLPKEKIVKNDIQSNIDGKKYNTFIISGPNAGGKTVVLKTLGISVLLIKAGLHCPCSPDSKVYLFDNVYVELGDSQDIRANVSTFSSHLKNIIPIIEGATGKDLVLLDELGSGTDPMTGGYLAQSILEHLSNKSIFSLVTTHFNNLKSLAVENHNFRNGAMSFSKENLKPTYGICWDIPGESFGLELAADMGLPASIIERTQALIGMGADDQASINEMTRNLQSLYSKNLELQAELKDKIKEAENQKFKYQHELKLLSQKKQEIGQKLQESFSDKFEELKTKINTEIKKQSQPTTNDSKLKNIIKSYDNEIRSVDFKPSKKDMGEPLTVKNAKIGQQVYIVPMDKHGVISANISDKLCEVSIGILKLKVAIKDLRLTGTDSKVSMLNTTPAPPSGSPESQSKGKSTKEIPFQIQTEENTIDIRGKYVDEGIDKMWRIIDKAILKGLPYIIIIHGHGNGELKRNVRYQLNSNPHNYSISYRSGGPNEGGDGVTVVKIQS